MSAATESAAISEDGKFFYAAEKNAVVTGQPNGTVQIVSLKDSTITKPAVAVPGARWISLNHTGNLILVFSDQSNTVVSIDPTVTTPVGDTSCGTIRPTNRGVLHVGRFEGIHP